MIIPWKVCFRRVEINENERRFRICTRTPAFKYGNAFRFRLRSRTPLLNTETRFVSVSVLVHRFRLRRCFRKRVTRFALRSRECVPVLG